MKNVATADGGNSVSNANGGNNGNGNSGNANAISHSDVYNRSNSNVTHMPDVVTKVTQNSMSFTAEQRPRKQST